MIRWTPLFNLPPPPLTCVYSYVDLRPPDFGTGTFGFRIELYDYEPTDADLLRWQKRDPVSINSELFWHHIREARKVANAEELALMDQHGLV